MFILLVVAVALIQLFRSFMGQQSEQFQQTMTAEQLEAARKTAQQKCASLCSEAQMDSCSDAKIAEWCLEKTAFDYDKNGQARSSEWGEVAVAGGRRAWAQGGSGGLWVGVEGSCSEWGEVGEGL